MSRNLTDAELIAIADRMDWWMPSWPGPQLMRSLRDAMAEAMARADFERVTLFRAGGFGSAAVWLKADDIRRLDAALRSGAAAA